jgi:hypothetical protein
MICFFLVNAVGEGECICFIFWMAVSERVIGIF